MTPPSIITVTMNPALDITVDADEVVPTEKVRCRGERYDAGGGGVNVARFARALGASVSAVFTAGGHTGARLADLVTASGVDSSPVGIRGTTRESFTVNDRCSGTQFRFVLPGPSVDDGEQDRCLDILQREAVSARFVVASGSLPLGVPPDFYQRVATVCARAGVPLILDTSGGGLTHVTAGVFLLKPSVRELRECSGRALDTEQEQTHAARELIDNGVAAAVLVSLGAQGSLLVTPSECARFPAIPVPAASGVGAGDAMVAGLTVGLVRGWTLGRSVRYGVAAATAKLQTPGTLVFDRAQVERFFESVPMPSASEVRS